MTRILLIMVVGCFLASCQEQAGDIDKISPVSGYAYEHMIEKKTAQPKPGDFVYFKMDLYDHKDSLLQTYRGQDPLPSVEILNPTDENRKRNPLVDVISFLSVGDSAAIIVPADSLGGLPPNMAGTPHIEYHVVPTEIVAPEEHAARMAKLQEDQMAAIEEMKQELPRVEALTQSTLTDYKAGRLDVKTTPGGVKYFIHERGDGDLPVAQNMVTMNYYGLTVSDGKRFDDSFSRGRGYTFRVANDQVIQGWHDIAPFLPLGSKASVFIPSDLGYGERGSPPNIGPGAELYFYMEVADLFY